MRGIDTLTCSENCILLDSQPHLPQMGSLGLYKLPVTARLLPFTKAFVPAAVFAAAAVLGDKENAIFTFFTLFDILVI